MSTIQTLESEFTSGVVERLWSLRFRWLAVNMLTAFVFVLSCLGIAWSILAGADYVLEFAHGVRRNLAILVALIGMIGFATGIGWVVRNGNLKNLIRKLETRFPDFGQRLRTVLDIHEGRFDAPAPMQRVLGNQTLARWETSTPSQMIAYRKLWQWIAIAVLVTCFLLGSLAMGNQWSLALRRSLGADVPYTVFSVEPGNIEVLEGTEVELGMKLEGRLDRKVTLRWRKAVLDSGSESKKESWIENVLEPLAKPDKSIANYSISLGKLRESAEYQFETSIGASEVFRIEVRSLVQVTELKTTVVPPAYIKAETRVFADNEVTALSGSLVTVQWRVSQPLAKLEIKIDERDAASKTIEAKSMDDPRVWELAFPSQRSLNWQAAGVGMDGTPLEMAKGKLRIRSDSAPHISWKTGDENIEVHTLAEVPLKIAVSDDFAVASAQIVLQFADGDERILAELDPKQISDSARIDLEAVLPLETLGLTQRDYLGYYAVARDNCDPNPRSTSTDVRFIDIRPLRQKFREQDMMPGQAGGRTLESLGELTKRQRLLINQTRRLINLPSEALSGEIKNIDRMVQVQSELAGHTAFLADFFVSQGNDDVESLRQAEAAMLQAADSLAAGTFDTALLQEQDALRLLVETRNELELLLNKNPAKSKQVKAAMAGLKMKLRRTRPPTALEIAARLELLANDQERVAKEFMERDVENVEAVEKGIEEQSELVATTNEIVSQVAKQTWTTKLIPERMDELVKSMADTEMYLKQLDKGGFQLQSELVIDGARELAALIRASNPDEPLETLSSLAALAQQAAKMQSEIATPSSKSTARSESRVEGTSSGSSGIGNRVGKDRQEGMGRIANQIIARAETIQDLLENLKAPGIDKDVSEAAAPLEAWLKQAGFAKTLEESKEAAGKMGTQSLEQNSTEGGKEEGSKQEKGGDAEQERKEALGRSGEYAAAADFMKELYQQLASPRLEQLKKLEFKARQLQGAKLNPTDQKDGGAGSEPAALTESEVKAGTKELEQLLERAGLEEIAELIQKSAAGDSDVVSYRGQGQVQFGLQGAVQALRLEIQAIIMEQISADRNTPVPQNYVEAVNRYFESISNPTQESESLR